MQKNYDIIIRAIDQASPTINRVTDNVSRSQRNIVRQAGDLGEVGGVKKVGKIFGDIADAGNVDRIRGEADAARVEALRTYRSDFEEVLRLEKEGLKNDNARIAAALFRKDLSRDEAKRWKELLDTTDEIGKREQSQLRFAGVSRVAGALGIAEIAGRGLQSAGGKVSDISRQSLDQGGTFWGTTGELARSIPGVGTLAKGFDSMGAATRDMAAAFAKSLGASKEWVGWLQSGAQAEKEARVEAEKVNAVLDKRLKDAAQVRDTIRQGIATSSRPEAQIETIRRQMDDAEARFQSARNIARGQGADSKVLADIDRAEALEMEEHRKNIATIRRKVSDDQAKEFERQRNAQRDYLQHQREFQQDLIDITREARNATDDTMTAILRAGGDVLEAELRDIRNRFEREREAIRDEIERTKNDPNLSPSERGQRVGALGGQLASSENAQAQAEREANRQGREDRLQKVADIERSILSMEAERGNVSARIDLRRLEVAERYRQLEEDITKALGDRNLTEDQRNRLLERRAGLAAMAERDMQDAGELVSVYQGRQRAGAVDGRGQGASVAQNAQVEVLRQTQMHAKTTAESSKITAEKTTRIETMIQDLLVAITGA